MYYLAVENEKKEKLELTENANLYQILHISGISSLSSAINLSSVCNIDGQVFNSSRVDTRELVLQIAIQGEIEENRIRLFRYFNLKKYIKVYYRNGTRNVYLEGYVEKIEIDPFENFQTAQISILCARPFFQSVDDLIVSFSTVQSNFEFPFGTVDNNQPYIFSYILLEDRRNVFNGGDVETGIIIDIYAMNKVVNPTIYNVDTTEKFGFTNLELIAGDRIRIDTRKGRKSINLIRQSIKTNIINLIETSSIWFQLSIGDNIFVYAADEGKNNMIVTFSYNYEYVGA